MLQQRLANFQNIAPGSTGLLLIPSGPTYDSLVFTFAGATATLARLLNPRLEINGKVLMQWKDMAELDKQNIFHGRDAALTGPPVQIVVHFRRPEITAGGKAGVIDAERITSLRTGDLQNIVFKVDFDAGYTDASAATVSCSAVVKPGPAEPSGLMTIIRSFTQTIGGAGTLTVNNLPRKGRIMTMHLVDDGVSPVSLKRNRLPLIDNVTNADLQLVQDANSRQADRTAATDRTVIDFVSNGNLDEAVSVDEMGSVDAAGNVIADACTDLELDMTLDAAVTFDVNIEYLGRYNQF